MGKKEDPDTETLLHKGIIVQNLNNKRKPREQRVPPLEENPRMKCKNCGAFGHTIRSKKCPIKSWDGAKVPLPLGVKKEKENHDPRKPKNLQSTEPVYETEKEKRERERLEQQRKALLLKFPKKPPERKPQSWKDTTHSGDYLRRPSRPSFIHTNKKLPLKCTQTSLLTLKNSDGEHTSPSIEKPNSILPLEENKPQTSEVPNMPKPATGHSAAHPTFSGNPTDQSTEHCFHPVPQDAFKVQEMGHMLDTQPPAQHSDEDKHSNLYSAAHADSQRPKISLKIIRDRSLQLLTQIIQNPPKKRRLSSYQKPQKISDKPMLEAFRVVSNSCTSPVESKGIPQVTSVEQHPPHNRAVLNFTQPFTEPRHPLSSQIPVQPLRMVFTRLRNDCWSSRIVEAASSHPPEKKVSSDKVSPSLKQSEGPYPRVPLSIIIRFRPPSSFEVKK
ncbi:Fam90a1b [Phodopus roborovskii]|uniref:Fam90a1b protein n=1 Tax=Phodopus roborovskii TaxID=109678 RepID=A0AAU9Z077_PHORO|nr:Fam90a1b [Phodopus roborovskii]